MKLFFHIRISSERLHFNHAIVQVQDVQTYDVDNFSDTLTVDIGSRAIEQAERLVLVIEVLENISFGGIGKILNTVKKLKVPFLIVYNGHHDLLDKMMLRFTDHVIQSLPNAEIQKKAEQFFSS